MRLTLISGVCVSLILSAFSSSNLIAGTSNNQSTAQPDSIKSQKLPLRTRHIDSEGKPLFQNQLIDSGSPYLLQHAHNPVNWYSWGEAAFAASERENKPLFISIGYSTCHWCHVMARESFEDLEIARFLNQHFISIKIDREQRPDIDATYQLSAAILSGHTGWPLNAFTTPTGAPFSAATYFPPNDFLQHLKQIREQWQKDQAGLKQSAATTLQTMQHINAATHSDKAINQDTYNHAKKFWLANYDEFDPGFGTAPKFPQESTLLFLLDQAVKEQDVELLNQVTSILDAMQQGGIYDHIGGGFHRYATDPAWQIPHFEKMLYNQGQLARVYTRAYRFTGDPTYKRTAVETLNYVLAELRSPSGLFYSATDADSEGKEGTFFLWRRNELTQHLTADETQLVEQYWALDQGPNFEDENVLYQPLSTQAFAIEHQLPAKPLLDALDQIKQKLNTVRAKRVHPHRDDKIITAWNAMLIQALLEAGDLFSNPAYTAAASAAAEQLWLAHYDNNRLLRDSYKNQPGTTGNLEDYAQFALVNLNLYRYTDNQQWLDRALLLGDQIITRFWNPSEQIMYLTEATTLSPIKSRSQFDDAVPAAESVAYELLTQLSRFQLNQRYDVIAQQMLASQSGKISEDPQLFSYLLYAHSNQSQSSEPIQFGAQGALKASLTKTVSGLRLNVALAEGWHINAQNPGDDRLVGSELSAPWLSRVSYPSHKTMNVNFSAEPIRLLSGELQFEIAEDKTQQAGTLKTPLMFRYQACSETQCLAPEVIYFY